MTFIVIFILSFYGINFSNNSYWVCSFHFFFVWHSCRKNTFFFNIYQRLYKIIFFIHFTMHSQPCFLPFLLKLFHLITVFCVFCNFITFWKFSIAIIAHWTFPLYGVFFKWGIQCVLVWKMVFLIFLFQVFIFFFVDDANIKWKPSHDWWYVCKV